MIFDVIVDNVDIFVAEFHDHWLKAFDDAEDLAVVIGVVTVSVIHLHCLYIVV